MERSIQGNYAATTAVTAMDMVTDKATTIVADTVMARVNERFGGGFPMRQSK